MELWIRSQDREKLINLKLLKVKTIDDNFEIIGSCDGIGKEKIGEYKTGERALEILDEIQKLLIVKKGMITTQDNKGIEFIPFIDTLVVYEMPKE